MKSIRLALAAGAALVCGTVGAASFNDTAKSSNDLWIESGKSGYSVEYVGGGSVAGLQFDLYDKGITEGAYGCGERLADTHIASCTLNEKEGFLRVVVFSMTNAALGDNTLVSINKSSSGANRFSASSVANSGATLKNIVFSDSQGQNVTPDHL
jgi:hypothetical protein